MQRLGYLFILGVSLFVLSEEIAGQIPKNPILLLELSCNNENANYIAYAFRGEDNKMWVREDAFSVCNIHPDKKKHYVYEKQYYYALEDTKWLTYLYDPNKLTIDFILPSSLFSEHVITLNQPSNKWIRPTYPGGYLNYDISLQKNDVNDITMFCGLTDLVYFNGLGVGNSSFLFQNGNVDENIVRLTTRWVLDQPECMTSWRVGDNIIGVANWSNAVQFAGIQYATNFSTQPSFVPFPLPGIRGQAVIPSTVNVYLDNQLSTSQKIGTGPYTIEGVPVVTGGGELIVHTHDILGRDRVSSLPYYLSQQFLEPGLESFSYETGIIRQNFGIESNDYSQMMLVGSYQKGLTESWTAGWHAELLKKQQTVGISSNHIIKKWLECDWAVAGSHNNEKEFGILFLLSAQRRTDDYNLGCQIITTSHYFQQIGIQDGLFSPKQLMQSYASYTHENFGSIGLSYLSRLSREVPSIDITTLSYNKSLYNTISLMASISHQGGEQINNGAFVSFIWSPKPDHTVLAGYQQDYQQKDAVLSIGKNLPSSTGYGYRVLTGAGDRSRLETDWAYQNDHALYQFMFSHFEEINNVEGDISGSLVHFVGETFVTRKIENSFIVVEMPEMTNVPVYKDNQLITLTNKNGFAFIPQALSYDNNVISIHPDELPLNTKIETTKMHAFPYHRSGLYLQFPISWTRQFTFNLMTSNGQFVPSGATVTLNQGGEYSVGYEGMVFVSEPIEHFILLGKASWEGNVCRFSSRWKDRGEPIIHLGTLTCDRI